ncbi:hypothetical protein ABZ916_39500 [Streptomyces sp. NPDC046853]|uniref:hypothetical protein n=1 Tax=Streptomyces sp. NPDC046853 TaxID=3154920 RepID=UPI0034067ECE
MSSSSQNPEAADRLSPQREAEIRNRRYDEVTPGPWLVADDQHGTPLVYVERQSSEGKTLARILLVASGATEAEVQFVCSARDSVPELLAELATVRAERDEARAELAKYVGSEPTVAEEMAYLTRCLDDVHAVCDGAEEESLRWENPLPVPEWVPVVREAADGVRPEAKAQDTLPAWLFQRFVTDGTWGDLSADDQSYWEHQARAVRRAVARNGFKAKGATS